MPRYSIVEMTSPDFDDSQWAAYFEFLMYMKEEHHLLVTSPSAEETKRRFLARKKMNPLFFYHAIYDKDRIVAFLDLLLTKDGDDKTIGSIMTDSALDSPAPELSAMLKERLIALLTEHGCPEAFCMAVNERASNLIASLGVKPMSKIERFQLRREQANHEIISEWISSFPGHYPVLELQLVTGIPDEYLDRYVDLYNQFIQAMPNEQNEEERFRYTVNMVRDSEASNHKVGSTLYTMLLLDSDKALIGFSNVSINRASPVSAYQAMTGIDSHWRGQGLSKWLKASLFVKVGKDFPENKSFFTDMRAVNKPIQTVNAQMGYRLISQGHDFTIRLADLVAKSET